MLAPLQRARLAVSCRGLVPDFVCMVKEVLCHYGLLPEEGAAYGSGASDDGSGASDDDADDSDAGLGGQPAAWALG